jgi:hypothetical protein
MTYRFFLSLSLAALLVANAPDARACGGCLLATPVAGGSQSPSVVTDHRIVLSLSGSSTTLWDQLEYQGDPDGFAWVLPVRGPVTVGVGSDRFVDALDRLTVPTIYGPTVTCRAGRGSTGVATNDDVVTFGDGSGGCGGSSAPTETRTTVRTDDGGTTGKDRTIAQSENDVTVTDRSTAGPYEVLTVRPAMGANMVDWLRRNGYDVPFTIEPILNAYTTEGFDFVAVRLRPGFGVRAMRPIRVTWQGSQVTFPLRLVAAGVGESVGIQLFVIGDGRWRTKSYPSFVVPRDELVWDFGVSRSNYTRLRASLGKGGAFALESSIEISGSVIPAAEPMPEAPAQEVDAGSDASPDAEDAATDAAIDSAIDSALDSAIDSGPAAPTDKEIAFPGGKLRRVTRLRADLPVSSLTKDLSVEADDTQTVLPTRISIDEYVHFDAVCPQADSPPPATTTTTTSTSADSSCECSVLDARRRLPIAPPLAIVASAAVLGAVRRVLRRRR